MRKLGKIFDCLVVVFAIIFVVGVYNIKAFEGYLGFAGLTLPAFQNVVESDTEVRKTQYSPQYYENVGTISNLTGSRESVNVAVICVSNECNNITSVWTTIPDREIKQIDDDGHITYTGFVGTYKIKHRNSGWGLTSASHSGGWFLDENRLPQ